MKPTFTNASLNNSIVMLFFLILIVHKQYETECKQNMHI